MSNCNRVYKIKVIGIEVEGFVVCIDSTKESRREIDRNVDCAFVGDCIGIERATWTYL